MSNGIRIRQNEDQSIAMLAAQRQLYYSAKRLDRVSIIFSVCLPFILSCVLLVIPKESLLENIAYIVSFISVIFSFLMDGVIGNKKELAASIQQQFDTYVFDMPWDSRIFDNKKNYNHEIATYSIKILSRDEEKNKLIDWYSPAVDEKTQIEGIIACQRENISWDGDLRKRYRILAIIIISLLSLFVAIIGVIENESISWLLKSLIFILPMLKWLMLNAVKPLSKDINAPLSINSAN